MCNWQQARVFENFLQDWVSSRSVSPSKSRPQSPPRSLPTYSLWQIYANTDGCCSVAKLCPTLCDPVDCSTPGFPVLHYLLESTQTHVHRVGDAIQPSHPLLSLSPPFPASGSFPMSRLSASGGQNIGDSASASVLPMNIQG